MDKVELDVYSREGCHLCDALLEELEIFCTTHPYQYKTIEITGDTNLEALYGTKVPVVSYEGNILCEYFLDTNLIEVYFDKTRN